MLESDHEIEDEQPQKQQEQQQPSVGKLAEDVAEKVVIDPLEGQGSGGMVEEPLTPLGAPKPNMFSEKSKAKDGASASSEGDAGTLKNRATKAVTSATASAKAGAAKAAKVGRETYEKVKEKTKEYRKEIGERTKKVAHATTEATLDAVGKALTMAENTKTYFKSVLSKEALQQMRKNAMEKYPQYFTGEADKNRQAFQDFLAEGAEPVFIEHGKLTQIPFRVKNGDVVRWNFRVLNDDIEFGVNIRKMQVGGAVEENVRQARKYKAGTNHQGSYSFVYSAGQVVISWSNEYSWFKGKHVAYIAEVVSAEDAAKIQTTGHINADADANATDQADAGATGGAGAGEDAGGEEPDNNEEDGAAAASPVVMQEAEDDEADVGQQLPAVASAPVVD